MPEAYIYILRCADGSYYTGLTRRDPDERLSEHMQGRDPNCYTYTRRPVEIRSEERRVGKEC